MSLDLMVFIQVINSRYMFIYMTKASSNTVTYFDRFGVEHIPEDNKKIIKKLSAIKTSQHIFIEYKHTIQ